MNATPARRASTPSGSRLDQESVGPTLATSSADGNIVRLSPGLFQSIAAGDVAPVVAEVALAAPRNGIVEIAGPERAPFNEIVARYLKAVGDTRESWTPTRRN
jgi:uncharacterized protein YbjT (DUF2867 family)